MCEFCRPAVLAARPRTCCWPVSDQYVGTKWTTEAAIVLVAGLVALTIVGAVVGLAWEFLCRIVPIVLVCAVVLAAIVGVLWLIGRVARALGGK